jgi:THO complex subunit 1
VVLKICNVLLQRLSKTQHTEFCGRVLIFLSKLFPISEQSGVNKYGEFNVDNTTIFDAKSDEDEISEKNELPETIVKLEDVDGHVIVDHEFYKKFWLLQTYFSSPANCYQSHQFAEFQHCAVAVLDTLSHEKARAVNTPPEADVVGIDVTPLPMYPKFLTSRRLIGLQLQDPVFRAIIIFQMLILFQFLLNPSSKFCHSAVLSAEALEWVKKTHERCLVMASQIRQHGKSCRGTVTHMLERERAWCEWKEQNCPSFDAQNKTFPLLERRTQTLEDRLRKRSFLGSKELSELFKRTDAANYEQLKKNNFVPDFDEFFEEALEQVSEDACIEEEYLLWHNSVWVARAVRLLTKANPAVFEFMKGGTIVEAVRYLQEKAKSQSREEPANDACSLGEESELEQCGDKRPRLEGSSEALK